jgi:uncharacterized membrane protein
MTKERLENFSDGIFSIIITIMVLDIDIPTTGTWSALTNPMFYSRFLAYVVSFLLITSFWISHHGLFNNIKTLDRTLLWVNALALFPISLVPLATAWFGEFPTKVAPSVVYGLVYVATVIALWVLSHVISQRITGRHQNAMKRLNRSRPWLVVMGLTGTALAFFWPPATGVMVFGVTTTWIIWIVTTRRRHELEERLEKVTETKPASDTAPENSQSENQK